MISRFFLFFLTVQLFFLSDRSIEASGSLATTEGIAESLVGGYVSAITGEFIDTSVDFALTGPEPLVLSRHYSTGNAHNSLRQAMRQKFPLPWRWNHAGLIGKERMADYSTIYPAGGGIVLFESVGFAKHRTEVALCSYHGLTNAGSGIIGGSTNLKNLRIIYEGKESAVMMHPSGSYHRYKYDFKDDNSDAAMGGITKYYSETDHTRVDQSKINYSYKPKKRKHSKNLTKIEALNPDGSPIASLNFTYPKKFSKKSGQFSEQIEASNGQKSTYTYSMTKHGCSKFTASYSHKPEIDYSYVVTGKEIMLLSEKRWGDKQHYLKILYNAAQSGGMERVNRLLAPWGAGGAEIPIWRFEYAPKYTAAFDALGRRTHYHYDENDRLTSLVKFQGAAHYASENFSWRAKSRPNEGNLLSKTIVDSAGKLYSSINYQYDKRGNVDYETLTGNLSGKGENETYAICRAYANCPHNNLLETCDNSGKRTCFFYYPHTALVTATFQIKNGVPELRELRDIDPTLSALTKLAVDDGCTTDKNSLEGVTERHITYFSPRKIEPVGLPEIVEKRSLDSAIGQERLLTKSHKSYLKTGELSRETVFDQNNQPRYTLEWDYDAHGNETRSKNALGYQSFKRYDVNDRLVWEKSALDCHYEYAYDLADRLVVSKEVHADGKVFSTSHKYDAVGNKIAITDAMGHETLFFYDEFNRLIKTVSPDGATVLTEYNVLNQPIKTTDPLGHTTQTEYNLRGKPTKISHPDGTVEQFEYYLDGSLKKAIGINGVTTTYFWDNQDRLLVQEERGTNGELFARTQNDYNAFHLLKTTDIDGHVTEYSYDLFGRLIREKGPLYETKFEYDPLGNLEKTIKGEQILVQIHDLLGQIIEERLESLSGEVFTKKRYAYDEAGRCIHNCEGNDALTQTFYDPKAQPVLIIDPLGHKTHIEYSYAGVFVKTTTDPLGQKTIETHDNCNRLVKIEKQNPLGITLAKQEIQYDLKGQKIAILDAIFHSGEPIRSVTHQLAYDPMGHLIRLVEAAGEPEQKVTTHRYNSLGQKTSTLKPDGQALFYTYNERGALQEFYGSDGSFHSKYTYNSQLQPTLIQDLTHSTENRRTYDAEGQLTYEQLDNGLQLSYLYDTAGRLIRIDLPDGSSIAYTYNPFTLKEIRRGDVKHTYDAFNALGQVTQATLANGTTLQMTYDLLGRPTSIESPYFTENNFKYDPVGHLTHTTRQDSLSTLENTFAYDDLYQLTTEREHTYTHDSLNNRRSKDGIPYAINALNQITSQGDTRYKYDLNGNLIVKETPIQKQSIPTMP